MNDFRGMNDLTRRKRGWTGGEYPRVKSPAEFPGVAHDDAEACVVCDHIRPDFIMGGRFCVHPCRNVKSPFPACYETCPKRTLG